MNPDDIRNKIYDSLGDKLHNLEFDQLQGLVESMSNDLIDTISYNWSFKRRKERLKSTLRDMIN